VSRPDLGPTQPPVQWVAGFFSPGVKRGRVVTLTTHPHPMPRSGMSRSYTSSPPSASVACSGTALALTYSLYLQSRYRNQRLTFPFLRQQTAENRHSVLLADAFQYLPFPYTRLFNQSCLVLTAPCHLDGLCSAALHVVNWCKQNSEITELNPCCVRPH
jgi:hypothetical protein